MGKRIDHNALCDELNSLIRANNLGDKEKERLEILRKLVKKYEDGYYDPKIKKLQEQGRIPEELAKLHLDITFVNFPEERLTDEMRKSMDNMIADCMSPKKFRKNNPSVFMKVTARELSSTDTMNMYPAICDVVLVQHPVLRKCLAFNKQDYKAAEEIARGLREILGENIQSLLVMCRIITLGAPSDHYYADAVRSGF